MPAQHHPLLARYHHSPRTSHSRCGCAVDEHVHANTDCLTLPLG
jgi:hypothetical protein